MRAFFAVMPPPSVADHLVAALDPLRDADTARLWRWARSDCLHVTLAFLGDLPDAREDDLVEAAAVWATRQEPVDMRWAGAGAFPAPEAARVLWVGVDGPDAAARTARWARGLRDLSSHLGVRVDGRRFTPHVTVARAAHRVVAGRWVQALDAYASPVFPVDRLALVASHLREGGAPRYEIRASFALGE